MRPWTDRSRGEEGQVAVLIIGLTLVLAMAVVVVVDANAAFLKRQALDTLADGAALAAADGIAGEQVYTTGLGDRALIDPETADAFVVDYLDSVGAGRRHPGLTYVVEPDGDRVVVRLAAPLDLPLPLPGVVERTNVGSVAAAVAVVGE